MKDVVHTSVAVNHKVLVQHCILIWNKALSSMLGGLVVWSCNGFFLSYKAVVPKHVLLGLLFWSKNIFRTPPSLFLTQNIFLPLNNATFCEMIHLHEKYIHYTEPLKFKLSGPSLNLLLLLLLSTMAEHCFDTFESFQQAGPSALSLPMKVNTVTYQFMLWLYYMNA